MRYLILICIFFNYEHANNKDCFLKIVVLRSCFSIRHFQIIFTLLDLHVRNCYFSLSVLIELEKNMEICAKII